MFARRSLLRGVAVLALAATTLGTASAPVAAASPLDSAIVAETVKATLNKPKIDGLPEIPGIGELPGIGDFGSGGSGVGDIPIIGDVANTFKDAEPEEIVQGAIQFAGFAAETVVPLIRELADK